jgi:filamentous hemagglutinin
MTQLGSSQDINQTIIIESLLTSTGSTEMTACTTLYTGNIVPCDDSNRLTLTGGVSTFSKDVVVISGLTANTGYFISDIYSGGTNLLNIFQNLEKYVTGTTFSNNNLTLKRNDNVDIVQNLNNFSGLTIDGNLVVTGNTIIGGNSTISGNSNTFGNILSGGTDLRSIFAPAGSDTNTFVTAATFNNLLTLTRNDNVSLNVPINTLTGLTVNGAVNISGLTTISNSLSATTISATTFYGNGGNLTGISTQDTRITGFTYNTNTFTITNSTGGTLNASFNTVTGLTVNGNLTVTGTSNLNGTIVSSNLSGSTDRFVEVNSGGTISATRQIITAYLVSGSTAANLLENTNNWDIYGNYTGTSITGTYMGQKFYNDNYFFEAITDNFFIRLIRG